MISMAWNPLKKERGTLNLFVKIESLKPQCQHTNIFNKTLARQPLGAKSLIDQPDALERTSLEADKSASIFEVLEFCGNN